MPTAASAMRYAQAVFQIALDQDELDGWLEDMTLLAQALESRELAEFLDALQVSVERKVGLIRETIGDTVAPLALNLLSLLASRSIAHLLTGVLDQYQRLLDAHRGIDRAEIVSAIPLDDQQRQRIIELLKGITGNEVRLTSRVEPQILGGFVARVGYRVIDGSTRSKLGVMRRELVERLR